MNKRVLAAALWLFAGWYVGSTIAFHLGLSEVLGPILGAAAAGIIVADPRRIIWAQSVAARTTRETQPESI